VEVVDKAFQILLAVVEQEQNAVAIAKASYSLQVDETTTW
jgi:hypothetical protein